MAEVNDLVLKDWEMTKDRIKHFDDVVIRMRLHGIPIATAIQAAGLFTSKPIVIALGSAYLIPIFFLDLLHYHLMLISVRHAKKIESLPNFKDKLQITTKLTSPVLTWIHSICAILIYAIVIIGGLIIAYTWN